MRTVEKVFGKSEHFCTVVKVFGQSGKFPDSLEELGSISARVLSNQSVRACELGSFLLLGVSGTMV